MIIRSYGRFHLAKCQQLLHVYYVSPCKYLAILCRELQHLHGVQKVFEMHLAVYFCLIRSTGTNEESFFSQTDSQVASLVSFDDTSGTVKRIYKMLSVEEYLAFHLPSMFVTSTMAWLEAWWIIPATTWLTTALSTSHLPFILFSTFTCPSLFIWSIDRKPGDKRDGWHTGVSQLATFCWK